MAEGVRERPVGVRMKVKICGLTNVADAELVGRAGADYVGAVLVPGTPRVVRPETARAISEAAGLPLVIVVADLSAEDVVRAASAAGAQGIQLHGNETEELMAQLRSEGDWDLWKVARVRSALDIEEAAERYGGVADALLLDAWHPDQMGGTGTSFAWDLLERLRTRLPEGLLVGVAGGLDPGNVREAVLRMRPHMVDVSSGVERSRGHKDPDRVRDFIRAARDAWDEVRRDDPRPNDTNESRSR